MDAAFTAEQEELRRTVRSLFDAVSSEADVRALMETDSGFDPDTWKQLAELGLLGLTIPEEHGGAGYGLVELGIVLEEAGWALLCAPLLSSAVLATSALLAAGDDAACAAWLPRLAEGGVRGTVAFSPVTATLVDGAWSLTGEVSMVVDGASADIIIARSAESLFVVEADAVGLSRESLEVLDQTRRMATLRFASTPAVLLGAERSAEAVLAGVLDVSAVALAAESLGGAHKTLDMAVGFAGVREQFGRPIGSFQAIKHRCADMLLAVERARSAAYYAMWAVANGSADLALTAPIAKLTCTEAFYACATSNVQIHGGIGFTWEHPAHLYLKRAKTSQLLFGDASAQLEKIATRAGI